MDKETRRVIEKANDGQTLSDDEMTTLYCDAPQILYERDAFENGLLLIARGGLSAEEMQHLAIRFLPPGSIDTSRQ